MRAAVYFYLTFALLEGIAAQDMAPDTTLYLRDVTISSSRYSRFASGQHLETLDSLEKTNHLNATLSELIPSFTSSMARNYGAGTLTTLSFRGTSANHTALLWNGIRLAPPNIAYVDLSLIQGSFFKNISVLYGGASPMFGSGSVGASIHLENKPVFEKHANDINMSLSAGSFGTLGVEAQSLIYRKKFYSSTTFSLARMKNDFSYINLTGDRNEMTNSGILRSGFIQDLAVLLPRNQYLMASLWFQYADRQIPPTLTEDTSAAAQMDRSWRSMLVWKDYNARNSMEAKLAYFNEFTRYADPLTSIYSVIKSQTLTSSFESTLDIKQNGTAFAGVQYLYEQADLVNYQKPRDQQSLAIYASYKHIFPSLKWQIGLNGRQEFLTGFSPPFLFSVGAEGRIWRFISGRFSVSRNFRAPTLNERYWVPGGNPDVKSETSWNEEAGIFSDYHASHLSGRLSLTFFNSRVDNWILWLPVTSSYWAVENAQAVWSRGVEITAQHKHKLNEVDLFIHLSYTFSKSTNEKKLFDLDASYKKQLIYTPLHRLLLKPGVLFKGFSLYLKGSYTGLVYTSKDNMDFIPAFFLLDAGISKTMVINKIAPFTIQVNVNNVLNEDYQVTPYRPMPGINFLVTLKAGLKSVKNDVE